MTHAHSSAILSQSPNLLCPRMSIGGEKDALMKKRISLLWVAIITLCGPLSSGYCDDTISWIYLGFPPVHIEDGPFANKGYGDFVLHLLINNLKAYRHKLLKCNIARAQELLKNQAKVAHPAFLKRSDRTNYVEVSIPAYVLIPNAVLVFSHQLGKFRPYIDSQGKFLLERAIMESSLKVGISAERAYGGIIDQILMKHKNHKNIFVNYDDESLLRKLLSMMNAGRLDYIIGYPNEGQYYAKSIEKNMNLVSFPIAGMPDYFLGYIAVPKNDWGKSIIEKINLILEENRNTPEYHAAYEFWLDENSVKHYRQYVRKVYSERKP